MREEKKTGREESRRSDISTWHCGWKNIHLPDKKGSRTEGGRE